MVKYIVIIMVLWLILSIGFSYMTYLIGYTKGFNKCKRIDDEILDKYSKEREWVWQDLYQSNQMDYIVDFRVSRIVLQHGIWREKIQYENAGSKRGCDVLDNYLKPFDMVVDMYYPNNMTKEEFDKFLEETGYDEKSE